MTRIHLSEYAKSVGQEKAAIALGVRQGAISKALKNRRKIYVLMNDDGTVTAEELRAFPCVKTKAKR